MKIIFICTGNTCRSPLAESYAKTKFLGGDFESRGLMVISGDRSSEAVDIIERESLVPPSRPSQLRPEGVGDSLLLTGTEQHKMQVEQRYPGADVRRRRELREGA